MLTSAGAIAASLYQQAGIMHRSDRCPGPVIPEHPGYRPIAERGVQVANCGRQ
jgi:hypothetical protein